MIESGNVRRLTFSDSTNSAPAISPDGTTVAFMSTRTEKPQLWLLPLGGGEPRQLTDLPQGVGGGAVWSPDGTKIAFTAGPQDEPRKPERPYRVTRTVWRFDEIGVLDDAVQDVVVSPGVGVRLHSAIDMHGTTDHPGLLVEVVLSRR